MFRAIVSFCAGVFSKGIYFVTMSTVTFCYSNHRSEILDEMEDVMLGSDMVIVEEPPHPAFASMLAGKTDIDDILLELDFEYPHFIRRYYKSCCLPGHFSIQKSLLRRRSKTAICNTPTWWMKYSL